MIYNVGIYASVSLVTFICLLCVCILCIYMYSYIQIDLLSKLWQKIHFHSRMVLWIQFHILGCICNFIHAQFKFNCRFSILAMTYGLGFYVYLFI